MLLDYIHLESKMKRWMYLSSDSFPFWWLFVNFGEVEVTCELTAGANVI